MQTFDVRKGLSPAQIEWAKSHDWYRDALRDDSGAFGVVVMGSGTQLICGQSFEYRTPAFFTDYQALRAWAGY